MLENVDSRASAEGFLREHYSALAELARALGPVDALITSCGSASSSAAMPAIEVRPELTCLERAGCRRSRARASRAEHVWVRGHRGDPSSPSAAASASDSITTASRRPDRQTVTASIRLCQMTTRPTALKISPAASRCGSRPPPSRWRQPSRTSAACSHHADEARPCAARRDLRVETPRRSNQELLRVTAARSPSDRVHDLRFTADHMSECGQLDVIGRDWIL